MRSAPFDVNRWIEDQGIALLSARGPVPNLASAIAGEPVYGSWWAHPASHAIFAASQTLSESPDVLTCKLIDGKVTFVHRRLWPDLVALAEEIGPERLARVDEDHTPSGKHVKRVTPFPDWAPDDVRAAAAQLTPDKARAALGSLAAVVLKSAATDPGGRTKPRSHT